MYVGICAATNVLIVYTHTHIQMYICIWFSMSKIDPCSGSRETAKLHPACRNPQFRSPLSLNAQGHQSSGICGYPHKKSRVQFSNKLSALNAKHQTSPPNFGNWRNIGCRLSGSQGKGMHIIIFFFIIISQQHHQHDRHHPNPDPDPHPPHQRSL